MEGVWVALVALAVLAVLAVSMMPRGAGRR